MFGVSLFGGGRYAHLFSDQLLLSVRLETRQRRITASLARVASGGGGSSGGFGGSGDDGDGGTRYEFILSVALADCEVSRHGSDAALPHAIQLRTRDDAFLLVAADDGECRDWLGALTAACEAQRPAMAVAPTTAPIWELDAARKRCAVCDRAFSGLRRRHHCRKCGKVVCAACSPQKHHAVLRFAPSRGKPVRVCSACCWKAGPVDPKDRMHLRLLLCCIRDKLSESAEQWHHSYKGTRKQEGKTYAKLRASQKKGKVLQGQRLHRPTGWIVLQPHDVRGRVACSRGVCNRNASVTIVLRQ